MHIECNYSSFVIYVDFNCHSVTQYLYHIFTLVYFRAFAEFYIQLFKKFNDFYSLHKWTANLPRKI